MGIEEILKIICAVVVVAFVLFSCDGDKAEKVKIAQAQAAIEAAKKSLTDTNAKIAEQERLAQQDRHTHEELMIDKKYLQDLKIMKFELEAEKERLVLEIEQQEQRRIFWEAIAPEFKPVFMSAIIALAACFVLKHGFVSVQDITKTRSSMRVKTTQIRTDGLLEQRREELNAMKEDNKQKRKDFIANLSQFTPEERKLGITGMFQPDNPPPLLS